MNIHEIEIYTALVSIIVLANLFLKFRKVLMNFVEENMRKIETQSAIDEEIRNLENQIETVNKNLILVDNNIHEISLTLKKLNRVYQSKEQDLKEGFFKIKNDCQVKIVERYQKKLLIEIIELASAQIINNKEMQKQFVELFSNS